jgi:NAD(P)-dependent dehydrogenase (short-subunit alcohol dehydrogenase family)
VPVNARPAAVVTGGAQGIGRATVRELLERGYAAVIVDCDREAGAEALEEYRSLGPVRFMAADVAEEADVARVVSQTVAEFGRLDVLVNNAAVSRRMPVTELSLADWNRVLAVNLGGSFLCAKHAAPHLRAARGVMVNIASTRALMSEADTEAYSASKGGVVALTHALAMSLAPEVRVNCVSPGWIETSDWQKASTRRVPRHSERDRAQHPVGRVGRPADVAALIAYLVSPEAGFVSGANIVIDGGMTRKMIYED